MGSVGIIILAAGGSTRLGRPKQLLEFEGRSLVRRAAQAALASICRPVVVVLGAHAKSISPQLSDLGVATVTNRQWEMGMGSSIKVGLQTMAALDAVERRQSEGVLLMVADQPLVTAALLNELALTHCLHGGIVASSYNDTVGVPAVFDRRYDQELCSLPPRQGAKSLIEHHGDDLTEINFPGGALDIDTAEDYNELIEPNSALVTKYRSLSLPPRAPAVK